ncbi:DUF4127 family protein [Pectinatus sottacetonis]|uniref:DUF4127 family protein n=1 Tax=Pectinatus sottacetonis TaxID=1002795 RepID=UPI0018C45928|nr:DUF4127 family protein [Pectinatus sottacetonis]
MYKYLSVENWDKILAVFVVGIIVLGICSGNAAAKKPKQKIILYVPHDDRPISNRQTVQVVQKAGFVIKVPPDKLLGNCTTYGNPDGLYEWIIDNAKGADAAVISSDAMLYGSLVASRKHELDKNVILQRAGRFVEIHRKYPKLPVYVFSSIMRTPKNAAASGTEEPEYYQKYGSSIFNYTALLDKDNNAVLTDDEQARLDNLKNSIPRSVFADWFERRQKNFTANRALLELIRNNIISYLALGCDDSAPFSQTHAESVLLAEDADDLSRNDFRIISGVDELGLLLLTRAINKINKYNPLVAIGYADGYGGATIPAYSDEPIDDSVRSEIYLAGGRPTTAVDKAAMLVLVNTNVSGWTYEAGESVNSFALRANTLSFANEIQNCIERKIPVAVGDIAYANGSDNALMKILLEKNLLFKLTSYAGWNTATNSTGWVVGEGILSLRMKQTDKNQLLLTRYIDDWMYQANVRQQVARQLNIFPGRGTKLALGDKTEPAEIDAKEMAQQFFDEYMPFLHIKSVKVTFPWDRLFEAYVQVSNNPDEYEERFFHSYKK